MKALCIAFKRKYMVTLLEWARDVPLQARKSLGNQVLLMDGWIKHLHPDAPACCVAIETISWNGQAMTAQVSSSIDHLVAALDMKLLGHQCSFGFDGVILRLEEIDNV